MPVLLRRCQHYRTYAWIGALCLIQDSLRRPVAMASQNNLLAARLDCKGHPGAKIGWRVF